MYQYLYAIADRLPAAWRPPDASVGGPVALRRLGDLVVLVSALERLPEANARTLALHHDVVASTLEASGTVPFRFGVVVDAADLDAWLAAHAPPGSPSFRPGPGPRTRSSRASIGFRWPGSRSPIAGSPARPEPLISGHARASRLAPAEGLD